MAAYFDSCHKGIYPFEKVDFNDFFALKTFKEVVDDLKKCELDVGEFETRILYFTGLTEHQFSVAETLLSLFENAKKSIFGEPIFDFLACLYEIYFSNLKIAQKTILKSENGTGVNRLLCRLKMEHDFFEYRVADDFFDKMPANKDGLANCLYHIADSIFYTCLFQFTDEYPRFDYGDIIAEFGTDKIKEIPAFNFEKIKALYFDLDEVDLQPCNEFTSTGKVRASIKYKPRKTTPKDCLRSFFGIPAGAPVLPYVNVCSFL